MSCLPRLRFKTHVVPLIVSVVVFTLVVFCYIGIHVTGRSYHSPASILQLQKNEVPVKHSLLDSIRKAGISHNLAGIDLDRLSEDQVFLTLHSYLDNIDTICHRKFRMGHIGDGGWEVCDDPDVRPYPPCVVYSYGIANDWSFDDDISRLYECHIFSFDPSIGIETYNRSELVHFYKVGLSGETTVNSKGWSLYTHKYIRAMLGHNQSTIDIIKMDVENSEWSALADMLVTDQLKDVKQLFIEFHISKKGSFSLARLKVIQSLEAIGFKRFYVHKNQNCKVKDKRLPLKRTYCYEVHYVKRS